jgi:hypothetical protein
MRCDVAGIRIRPQIQKAAIARSKEAPRHRSFDGARDARNRRHAVSVDPLRDLPSRDLRDFAVLVRSAMVAGNDDADRVRRVQTLIAAFERLGEAILHYNDLMARMSNEQ